MNDRFARLALTCVHKEYPNKISHVLNDAGDAKTPAALTPAFYGCFDWHSSVHGHWLLARILKTDPASPMKPAILAALDRSFTKDNIAAELAYIDAEGRKGFERPYGTAWLLQLVAELDESDDPKLKAWRETLRPLEERIVAETQAWLPKLAYPIRLGTHNQSAFAFGLMIDYARQVGNGAFEKQLADKALEFHRGDVNCPLAYEPSGEDFLSPCLMEADLMRRVMPQADYAAWLGQVPAANPERWFCRLADTRRSARSHRWQAGAPRRRQPVARLGDGRHCQRPCPQAMRASPRCWQRPRRTPPAVWLRSATPITKAATGWAASRRI